jgi:hypothetical protein
MPHQEQSVFDSSFLNTVEQWFTACGDIFVVARYSKMAGARYYFWFKKFDTFRAQLDLFPSQTDVIVFRDNQFPLRGIVDESLIGQALNLIPDKTEAMIAGSLEPPDSRVSIWAADTHTEMLDVLQDKKAEPASIGFYAPWHEPDNESMISAVVPLPDGTLKRGVY